jgi:hypothetical protein
MDRIVRSSLFVALAALVSLSLTVGTVSVPASAAVRGASPPTIQRAEAPHFTSATASIARVNFKGVIFKRKRTVINLDRGKKRRNMINKEHRWRGRSKIPYCAKKYIIKRNGKARVKGIADRCTSPVRAKAKSFRSLQHGFTVAPKGFWGWWDHAKCAATVAVAVGSLVFAWAKLLKVKKYAVAIKVLVKQIGGFKATAKRVVNVLKGSGSLKTKAKRLANGAGGAAMAELGKALLAVSVTILDVDEIKKNCG